MKVSRDNGLRYGNYVIWNDGYEWVAEERLSVPFNDMLEAPTEEGFERKVFEMASVSLDRITNAIDELAHALDGHGVVPLPDWYERSMFTGGRIQLDTVFSPLDAVLARGSGIIGRAPEIVTVSEVTLISPPGREVSRMRAFVSPKRDLVDGLLLQKPLAVRSAAALAQMRSELSKIKPPAPPKEGSFFAKVRGLFFVEGTKDRELLEKSIKEHWRVSSDRSYTASVIARTPHYPGRIV